MALSDADRSKLTEEELAAMEELEQEQAELDEEADELPEEVDETEEPEEVEESEAEADEPEAEEEAEEEPEETKPSTTQQPAPLLRADLPEDVEQQLTEIETKRAELDQQFDDGELDSAEWRKAVRDLDKQEDTIKQQQFKAQLAQEMQEEQQRQSWLNTVNTFLDSNPEYREHELRYQALDIAVKKIANDLANVDLSGADILSKAHEQIVTQFGLTATKPEVKPEPKPKAKRPEAPPTLGKVPAAEVTGNENSKWSRLDKILESNPERFETELAKLSDSDRADYLATM